MELITTQPSPACPFCGATEGITLVAAQGGQLITSHWLCQACNTYFEALRSEFDSQG